MKPALSAAKRLRRMHDALETAYGPQHWWPAETPFEVVLGAYLTQNTAWRSVERSVENLRVARALSIAAIRSIALEDLKTLIRPSGFQQRKATAIKAFVNLLDSTFAGSLATMAEAPTDVLRRLLLALPGVGPETADAILLYALGHAVPVADEYLRRIVARHGLLEPTNGRGRYEDLAELTRKTFAGHADGLSAGILSQAHALVVAVGKAHCGRTARCEGCPLAFDLALTSGLNLPESPLIQLRQQ